MGAQNFNFAPKFPKMGTFQPQIVHFRRKKIPHSKISGEAIAPPPFCLSATTSLHTKCLVVS